MDWIKYFIIEKSNLGIKINNIAQGHQYRLYNNHPEHYNIAFYIDDNIHGVNHTYYYDFAEYVVENYIHGKQHGYQYNWQNRQLCSVEHYLHNQCNGVQWFWHKNNNIWCIENYLNNKKNGPLYRWKENGDLISIYNFKDGVKHGRDYYWENNKLTCILVYDMGREILPVFKKICNIS